MGGGKCRKGSKKGSRRIDCRCCSSLFHSLLYSLSPLALLSTPSLSFSLSLSISVSQGTRLEASAAEAAVDHRRVLFGGGHV